MSVQKHEYGYCVRCKSKQIIQDGEEVWFGKSTRRAVKGKCPKCGTGMYKILAKKIEVDI